MNKKIKIDSEKCVGCGICARTCKQSAIEMVNGKAVVTNGESCDKIGNCLPVCPVNAISFVSTNSTNSFVDVSLPTAKPITPPKPSICYGSLSQEFTTKSSATIATATTETTSMLRQWPVQIKLVLENAGFFDNANLLIAADCAAYAYANFHQDFMKNKVTIIGCPKLDEVDYTQKLTNIITNNNIKSLTIVRMEVPCCGGIENASKNALKTSGKFIPWQIATLSTDGKIVED